MNNLEKNINTKEVYTISEQLENSNKIDDEKKLKELLSPYKQGSIGIAQINTIAGDLESNSKKIIKNIIFAQNIGLDLVIFPELSLTGCGLCDAIKRFPVIVENNLKWLEEIAKKTSETTAIVGFISKEGEKYLNSLAVLADGKIIKTFHKSVNPESNIIEINGYRYNVSISDEISERVIPECDALINCCAKTSKEYTRHLNKITKISKQMSTPIICVNQIGATDNLIFDGISTVFDKNGNIFASAKAFKEQFLIINPYKNLGKLYSSVNIVQIEKEFFSLDYESDLERVYNTAVQGIKDYFSKTGFKRAVLGLSGGLDSTVCAVLLADALGKENVFGISMPSKITSNESKNDAQILAQNLGINFAQAPIKEMVETTNTCFQELFKNVETKWTCRYKQSFTMDNIQARSRAMYLWGISNEFDSCLPIATSDKSEAYMGYATINGDMSGGFAPIADITKTKLFALARWINKNRTEKNVIPQSVIDKRPGAELAINPKTGKPLIAEDALMPYEFLDEVIWRIENKKENYDDMINSEFLYEKQNKISKEQKIQWLDKFYKRMATALYKKSIMPPYVIIDSHSDNNCNYRQPITSSHINYKGLDSNDIDAKIQEFLNT